MDLAPFTARGFPGEYDQAIATVGVAGIDKKQAHDQVRICEETEDFLYHGYSPTRVRYHAGSRLELEAITAQLARDTLRQKALSAMQWVSEHVTHPHLCEPTPPNRALTEEQLIESGRGWCNEQTRVFIALCQVMEIPTRICFVYHANERCGHTCAEAFLDGRWAFFDVTFNVAVELPGGRLAEVRELTGPYRQLAHAAYRGALEAYYRRSQPWVAEEPGWGTRDRPAVERGGDLLAYTGICNYVIDGAEVA